MNIIFLQAAEVAKQILDQPGDSVSSKVVFSVLVTIIVAIGGYIMYLTKSILAPAISQMVDSMTKGAEAVIGLKEELIISNSSLKDVIVQGDIKIIASVESARDSIIEEVRDEKFKQLTIHLQNK